MAGYIYLPVPTTEMMEFCSDWANGQKAKGKTSYPILFNQHSGLLKSARRHFGGGVLHRLTPQDKLYILSHGAATGSSFIGADRGNRKIVVRGITQWTGGTLKKYSPLELALLLIREKLPCNFVDLRVFACGSGIVPNKEGVEASFAQLLAEEMRKLGFKNIQVTGYLGSVRSSYSIRQLMPALDYTPDRHKGVDIDNHTIRASMAKVVF
jgi:hypothetical protein